MKPVESWLRKEINSMNRYVLGFSKLGYTKYTSHLDMLRLFKRAFKKTGILLEHSQGFNPHPKMGFAQPLSLGYTSICELIEFETVEKFSTEDIMNRMKNVLPEGIVVTRCCEFNENIKSLAAVVEEATYRAEFPVESSSMDFNTLLCDYLAQEEIIAEKRQKKTKKMVEVNIKDKIRSITIEPADKLVLKMVLDQGSNSNLSPEQVLQSFLKFTGMNVERHDIEVERTELKFGKNLQF